MCCATNDRVRCRFHDAGAGCVILARQMYIGLLSLASRPFSPSHRGLHVLFDVPLDKRLPVDADVCYPWVCAKVSKYIGIDMCHMNERTHVNAHTYKHTYTHVQTHIHTRPHTHTHTSAHTHAHAHTHTSAHTHTHTHIHTHMLKRRSTMSLQCRPTDNPETLSQHFTIPKRYSPTGTAPTSHPGALQSPSPLGYPGVCVWS